MSAQTTFNINPVGFLSGMYYEQFPHDVVSYPCAEAIPPGRLVELNTAGTAVQLVQGGAGVKPLGVSVYKDSREPGVFAIGEVIAILRKGRIWADYSGGTKAALSAVNVKNSTTIATDRGKFSETATSTTTGAEITLVPGTVLYNTDGDTNTCLVELNLP